MFNRLNRALQQHLDPNRPAPQLRQPTADTLLPGDVVSLTGPTLAEPLLVALYRHVLHAGGHPIVVMAPEVCTELLLRHGSPEQIAFLNPLELCEVEAPDVAVNVLAPRNARALVGVEPARLAERNQALRPLLDRFLRRAADGALRWVVTQLPCRAAALNE